MNMKNESIKSIRFIKGDIVLSFADGRKVSTPLEFYPRLLNGTAKQRAKWEIIGAGRGIHWPDLDEDLTIEGIMHGIPSVEYRKPRRASSVKHTQPEARV